MEQCQTQAPQPEKRQNTSSESRQAVVLPTAVLVVFVDSWPYAFSRLLQEADEEDPAPWVVKGGAFGGAFGAGVGALVDVHNNRKLVDQLTATAEEHAAANQRQHTSDATMDLLSEPKQPSK